MSTKSELKLVRSLVHKKYRVQHGRFLVQGRKVVSELLGSGWAIDSIYATAKAAEELGLKEAIVLAEHELDRLGSLESGSELVAVVRMPTLPDYEVLESDELVLALDGISDPGNLGTILRIADWFGIRNVLCSPNCVDEFNPKTIQASMGSIFQVAVHRKELGPALSDLQQKGTALYFADTGGRSIFGIELRLPAVLVLGSESHGISGSLKELGGGSIAVPRMGGAESLNVAMAASALCMEFTRQRLAR